MHEAGCTVDATLSQRRTVVPLAMRCGAQVLNVLGESDRRQVWVIDSFQVQWCDAGYAYVCTQGLPPATEGVGNDSDEWHKYT